MQLVARTHDDCDGNLDEQLSIIRGDDGDFHISTDGVKYLRFRMPFFGGGLSENTYNALLTLMIAMEKDNESRPIRRYDEKRNDD